MKLTTLLAFFVCACAPVFAQPTAQSVSKNILFEGNFLERGNDGLPNGWRLDGFAGGAHGNIAKLTEDTDGNFVSLFIPNAEKSHFTLNLKENILLRPTWKRLLCSYDVRVYKFVQGPERHHAPRMQLTFLDRQGKEISSTGVGLPGRYTDSWQTAEREVAIPAGAEQVKLWVGTFSSTGQLDFRNLYVAPVE